MTTSPDTAANLTFEHAAASDIDAVCALYRDALTAPGCTWDDEYPSRETAEHDLAENGLYVLRLDGTVIGALSLVDENELDEFDCFTVKSGAREFARITVASDYRGKGCAAYMLRELTEAARRDGTKAWHILVACRNPSALALYRSFGFTMLKECEMYDNRYYAAEMVL